MKKSLIYHFLVVVLFMLFAVVVFRSGWGGDRVFSASDANMGLLAKTHRLLPEAFNGVYLGDPLFGGAAKTPVSMQKLARWLFAPEIVADTLYGFYLVVSSFFLVLYLRLMRIRWLACIFGALAACWVGSVTLAAAGHDTKISVMAVFCIALYLLEKSIRSKGHAARLVFAGLAGGAVGAMLLEQQDVGLLAGMFLGIHTLVRLAQVYGRDWKPWAEVLLPVAALGLALSVNTAIKAYSTSVTHAGIQSGSNQKWEFITQWSMVPDELPDLIAQGYTGWFSGNPDGPYWGRVGQSAEWESTGKGLRNLRLDSVYIGVIPLFIALFGAYAALRERKEERERSGIMLCWSLLALIALLLSFGKYSPIYKLFYHLPLVGNIRAPIKFLHNFQIMVGILAAYGLDQLWQREWKWKRLLVVCFVVAGLLGVMAMGVDSSRFSEWGQYASVIARTIRTAWLHALVMALLFAGAVFIRWKKSGRIWRAAGLCLLIAAMAADSLLLTRHYFKSEDITSLRQGNTAIKFLKENQGDERIYFLDSGGIYNRWLAVEAPYHGLNVFNIWQMPRMPQEYKILFAAAGRNQMRLWQLASVKYITAPASVPDKLPLEARAQLKPVMYYRFVREGEGITTISIDRPEHKNDQVLLEYTARIPRFALYRCWKPLAVDQHAETLFSSTFNPQETLLVDAVAEVPASPVEGVGFSPVQAKTTLHNANVQTDSSQAGILLFTQRCQPQWKATIDGDPVDIFVCNHLCMGVFVPSGKHEIRFSCRE